MYEIKGEQGLLQEKGRYAVEPGPDVGRGQRSLSSLSVTKPRRGEVFFTPAQGLLHPHTILNHAAFLRDQLYRRWPRRLVSCVCQYRLAA